MDIENWDRRENCWRSWIYYETHAIHLREWLPVSNRGSHSCFSALSNNWAAWHTTRKTTQFSNTLPVRQNLCSSILKHSRSMGAPLRFITLHIKHKYCLIDSRLFLFVNKTRKNISGYPSMKWGVAKSRALKRLRCSDTEINSADPVADGSEYFPRNCICPLSN